MLSVVLVPVIKNKSRRINDSDNYRPIALASIVSKVVEKVILNRISEYLLTTCNQFGFKNKLGTDMCIYALKEILENHIEAIMAQCSWDSLMHRKPLIV